MNHLVGKSTGIALLLAAAMLAALFAMGVFSATGVGADSHGPTITAAITDATPATPDDQDDDTVTIEITGLVGIGADSDNDIVITMPEDLGTAPTASWEGGVGNQVGDTLTIASYGTGGNADAYTLSFSAGTTIASGAAKITIDLGTDADVDTNTKITAMRIGRGDEGSATRNDFVIPAGGVGISGAPTGPSITLDPATATTGTEVYEVDVSGGRFRRWCCSGDFCG